jgi:hypothetical protein
MELYSFPYLKGLIVCGADEVAVADIVRPRDLGVGFASEWFALSKPDSSVKLPARLVAVKDRK